MDINIMDEASDFFFKLLILAIKKYSDACFVLFLILVFFGGVFSGQPEIQKLKKTEVAFYFKYDSFFRK